MNTPNNLYYFPSHPSEQFNNPRLDSALITTHTPTSAPPPQELAAEHSAQAIKDHNQILKISEHLIQNQRYRDNMLFIVGINSGLRASDLRTLRFSNFINPNLTFKDQFPLFEQKTRNTRKRKTNRYITINTATQQAITLFLENTPNVNLYDYMFENHSNNSKGEPISVRSMNRILKNIASEVGLNSRTSTHTLRKTFCYHQMMMDSNSSRKLLLLQKMLGHSSSAQTLDYIGITEEEIHQAYLDLNLGSNTHNYLVVGEIVETSDDVGEARGA